MKVGLVGLPNSGKTTVFNLLTGQKASAENYYTQEQIDSYLRDLVNGRRKFTEAVAEEGLLPEIIKAAEESFSIAPEADKIFVPSVKRDDIPPGKEKDEPVKKLVDWKPNERLNRDRGWRYG